MAAAHLMLSVCLSVYIFTVGLVLQCDSDSVGFFVFVGPLVAQVSPKLTM